MKNRVEIREQDYCTAMDGLRFSETDKARMAQRLTAVPEKPAKRARPLRRVVAVAACFVLAAVLAVGAGAVRGVKPLRDLFAPILGGSVAQTEIIDKVGRPIGASVTSNGITMTADAIIGDKYNACIIYTLTKDDGSRFLPEGVKAEEVRLQGSTYLMGTTGNSGSGRVFDEDPEDNEIQYINIIGSDDGEFQFGNIQAWFSEIGYYPGGGSTPESLVHIEPVTLAEGNWEMRFEVAYEDSSVVLSNGETTQYAGWNCDIKEVTVSSLGFHLVLETNIEAWEQEMGNSELGAEPVPKVKDSSSLMSIPVQVKKTDGTILDFSSTAQGGMGQRDGKTVAYKGAVFPEIIPLEELESVTIGDIEYKVNP